MLTMGEEGEVLIHGGGGGVLLHGEGGRGVDTVDIRKQDIALHNLNFASFCIISHWFKKVSDHSDAVI